MRSAKEANMPTTVTLDIDGMGLAVPETATVLEGETTSVSVKLPDRRNQVMVIVGTMLVAGALAVFLQ